MPDHTRAEIEGDDEGQRLVRAAREDASLFRHQGEADVRSQPQRSDGDDISKDGGEAMTDVALVCPTMDEPGGRGPEDVASEDLQDRQEVGRNALQGRVPSEEPGGEARESEEQEDPDQPRMVWGGRSGLAGQNRGRSRDGPAPEVEGDDDDYGIHEDGRYGPPLEENVPVRRGHDNRNRPAHAPMRESEGLGKLADRRDRHIRATVDGALKPDDSRLKKLEESRR